MLVLKTLISVLMIFLFCSCTSSNSLKNQKGTYLETVKINFDAGEQAFLKKDFDRAFEYYQFVKSKYPFSQFASLSELRMADAKFEQKKWLEAAALYEAFIKFHPKHEKINYAYYQIGLSYFNAIPQDNFFAPSVTTRDTSVIKDALSALEKYNLHDPLSTNSAQVNEKISLLLSKLAQHELNVAQYYIKIKKYSPAANRYLQVFEYYPDTKESAQALWLAAKLLEEKLHDHEQAYEVYEKIITYKKDSEYFDVAQKAILRLKKE